MDPTSADDTRLIDEITRSKRRVEQILQCVAEAYEDGHEKDHDEEVELEDTLKRLYPRVVAGLERYGHANQARALETEWRRQLQAGITRTKYFPLDNGDFVDCPAWTVLSDAAEVLRDAVAREQAEHRREEQRKEADSKAQLDRDEAAHRREMERRTSEADRDHKKREEDRKEAATGRKTQLYIAALSAAVGIAGVLGGNADKVRTLLGPAQHARAVSLEGKLVIPVVNVSNLEVLCLPRINGVFTAVAPGRWSLSVLPTVQHPLRLYCTGRASGLVADTVTVMIPKTGDNDSVYELPTISLKLSPSPTSPAQSNGSVDASP